MNALKNQATEISKTNRFYQISHPKLVKIVFFQTIIQIILIIFLIIAITIKPTPKYFASTPDGKLFEMAPLNVPLLTKDKLLQWTADSVRQAYTFDFANYKQQLQASSFNFTAPAWNGYLSALDQSGTIDLLLDRKAVVTATIESAPILISEGNREGVYRWQIQFPMMATFLTGSDRQRQKFIVTATVTRIPLNIRPEGIAIEQINFRSGGI